MPRSLQGKFILIFIALVIVTNGLFAVVGFSRENIYTANEALEAATFLGNIMQRPATAYFEHGEPDILKRIYSCRTGLSANLKVTLHDANWWRLWGDETRIPPEGFPDVKRIKAGDQLSGSGEIYREILFPLTVDDGVFGAIAIGIPRADLLRVRNTGSEFMLILIIGSIIGIIAAVFLSRALLDQLEQLTDGIESFGAGDYSIRVTGASSGEIKELADSFNRMALTVQETFREQKNREQQMLESEKWAVLGKLAASVAHEIRNPLVAIQSLVEIIGEEVQGDLKEHARVVLGEVHRLNRVVTELLSLVRPEMAHLRSCNLKDIINELLLLVRHEAARSGVKLVGRFPEELRQISVDAEKIKQAILNIMLNGFQAMKDGGQINISLEDSASELQISIANNGPVIPQDLHEKIFEPFFTTKSKGTGLGLAITRKIVELHEGRVELESDSDKTEFKIILPH